MGGIKTRAIIFVLANLAMGMASASAGPATQPTTRATSQPESFDFLTGKVVTTRPAVVGGKPVYIVQNNAMSMRVPGLTPATWAHVQLYADRPTPRRAGPGRWTDFSIIPLDNVRYMAKLTATGGMAPGWTSGVPDTLIVAGAITFYDWEGQYTVENVPIFERFLRTARETAPGVKIGLTLTPRAKDFLLEEWAAGLTPAQVGEFRKGFEPYRKLIDASDHVSAGCYVSDSDPAIVKRDIAGCRNIGRLVAAETGKPVYMWIRPTYGFGRDDGPDLSAADAKALFDMAREFDGAVIYSPDWATTRRVFVPLLGK